MIKALMAPVDRYLDHTTMYRVVLHYCAALLAADFVLGLFKLSPHDPAKLVFSLVIICTVSWLTNRLLALAFRVPANVESVWITALILGLLMPPVAPGHWMGMAGLAAAACAAIASKFILAINRKHVFNPVAFGVLVSAHALDAPATWWVAGPVWLAPLVVIGGLLVLRKVQRFEMFAVYALAGLAVSVIFGDSSDYLSVVKDTLLTSPLLFCGFAMLTEPMTAPVARRPSLAFGALVGALGSQATHIGEFYLTPEIALLAGNVFAWLANPKYRFKLTLERVEKMAQGCYDYVFTSNRPIGHLPGQYIDWTLHSDRNDSRGNRRTFTIASSPAEAKVRVGVKFYNDPSSFKQTMLNLKVGDVIYGSQLGGDFILPAQKEKLAFIAGGIGVTPFRAMIQHMMDVGEYHDVTLFYGNGKASEIAYVDVFNRAENELGLRTVYAVAESGQGQTNFHRGFIDADLIKREMPDFAERLFYVSGPRAMVLKFQDVLADLGIAKSRIKTDFFPGFA